MTGSDEIDATVNLPAGASVTYTTTATIDPAATGSLDNTAETDLTGTGVDDTNDTNDASTDTTTLEGQPDLSVSKTHVLAGLDVTYTITVHNAGPSSVTGATVQDTFPGELTGISWTCSYSYGSPCPHSGTGNINHDVDLPSGESAVFTVDATIDSLADGTVRNTATVASAGTGWTDPVVANNTSTDKIGLTAYADLQVTKTDGRTEAIRTTPALRSTASSAPAPWR